MHPAYIRARVGAIPTRRTKWHERLSGRSPVCKTGFERYSWFEPRLCHYKWCLYCNGSMIGCDPIGLSSNLSLHPICKYGGIGIHGSFRNYCPKGLEGSNPSTCTNAFEALKVMHRSCKPKNKVQFLALALCRYRLMDKIPGYDPGD